MRWGATEKVYEKRGALTDTENVKTELSILKAAKLVPHSLDIFFSINETTKRRVFGTPRASVEAKRSE